MTTATNIVVILVAGAMALDGNGPIRTQFGTWVDQYRDRRTAEEMWASVTEGLDRFVGGDSAPIAVVEFTDYQCPYCRRMDVIKQQANIADVRVVIRHLPLERAPARRVPRVAAVDAGTPPGDHQCRVPRH